MTEIKLISRQGTWKDVADSCRTTINKKVGLKEPSSAWKRKILLAEHSPIRQLSFKFKWTNLKYWVSVHFVRHKIGIEHFVSSQRTDRTGVNRDQLQQSTLVQHEIVVNAQAIINISRKRLCNCASKETRQAWQLLVDELKNIEPELYSVCVPDCIYRGRCYEFRSCNYDTTKRFAQRILQYRNQ